MDSSNGICGVVLLGTKFKPRDRTSICVGLSVLEERLVMYFCLLSSLWVSFLVCFLAFLFLYLGVLLLGVSFSALPFSHLFSSNISLNISLLQLKVVLLGVKVILLEVVLEFILADGAAGGGACPVRQNPVVLGVAVLAIVPPAGQTGTVVVAAPICPKH